MSLCAFCTSANTARESFDGGYQETICAVCAVERRKFYARYAAKETLAPNLVYGRPQRRKVVRPESPRYPWHNATQGDWDDPAARAYDNLEETWVCASAFFRPDGTLYAQRR